MPVVPFEFDACKPLVVDKQSFRGSAMLQCCVVDVMHGSGLWCLRTVCTGCCGCPFPAAGTELYSLACRCRSCHCLLRSAARCWRSSCSACKYAFDIEHLPACGPMPSLMVRTGFQGLAARVIRFLPPLRVRQHRLIPDALCAQELLPIVVYKATLRAEQSHTLAGAGASTASEEPGALPESAGQTKR